MSKGEANKEQIASAIPSASAVRVNATLFSYFILCQRKAWLFYYGIGMERHSELVEIGKILSEYSYPDKKHEINIDSTVVIDWVDGHNKVIHEVKKSRSQEEVHQWQVKYYLWYLEQKGLTGFTGTINYPLLRKVHTVELTDEDRQQIPIMLKEIKKMLSRTTPPVPERKPLCKNCAYFELCWI